MIAQVYHGTVQCQAAYKSTGASCRNRAYWRTFGKRYVCGMHKTPMCHPLPRDPLGKVVKEREVRARRLAIEGARVRNFDRRLRGGVVCTKLKMMKPVDYHKGYLAVFPNARHGGRTDGRGVPALSPKCMGPIHHGQPGLPAAQNLENLHQGGKVFASEVGEDGDVLPIFFALQCEMYNDDVAHRHKPTAVATGGNKNIPKFSLWVMPDGTQRRLTYFESRQVYCHFYEHIAKALPEFKELVSMLDRGYNLQIVGYDGYDVVGCDIVTSLAACYLDTTRPFGHELVLFTLLTCPNPADYPWRSHTFLDLPIPVPPTPNDNDKEDE